MERIEFKLTSNEFIRLLISLKETIFSIDEDETIKSAFIDSGLLSKLSVSSSSEFIYKRINSSQLELSVYFDNQLSNTRIADSRILTAFFSNFKEFEVVKKYASFDYISVADSEIFSLYLEKEGDSWRVGVSTDMINS